MNRIARRTSLVLGLVAAAALVLLTPSDTLAARPGLYSFRSGQSQWVTGCVRESVAARLVANAGFEYGNAGAPVLFLCEAGSVSVGRKVK